MVILGGSVSLSTLLVDYPTLSGQAIRYAVAAAGLAALAALTSRRQRRRPTGRDLVRLTALAATGLAGFNICLLAALRHADPTIVGTVVAGTPLLLAVLAPALRRQPPSGRLAGAAAFSLLAAPLLDRLGPLRVSAWSCAIAVPLLGLAAIAVGEPARLRVPTAAELAVLGYLGAVVTVLAFPIWYGGVHRLGVERAGMFAAVLPVATLAISSTMEQTAPSPRQAAGVTMVAAGLAVGLAISPDRRRLVDGASAAPFGGPDRVGVRERHAAQGGLRIQTALPGPPDQIEQLRTERLR